MRITLDHPYSGREIATLCGGCPPAADGVAPALTTDSREVRPGDLFVALRGEQADGHLFLPQAVQNGAALILCERCLTPPPCAVTVPDTWEALSAMAHAARRRIAPRTVAITGSVGKTTTKEMTAAVLATRFRTHKTAGNFNNRLGVCLTLLSMPSDTEVLVAELGMNHRGEIAALSVLTEPDAAIITNVGTAHIGNLGSRAAIAAAKQEIFTACAPGAPYLFPADERLLLPPDGVSVTPFPLAAETAGDPAVSGIICRDGQTVFDYTFRGTRLHALTLSGVGRHLALCAGFALTVGMLYGLSEEEMRRGLLAAEAATMRQTVKKIGGVTVILDCYNASPESMRAACAVLMTLARDTGGRRVALLGDMLELGADTRILHEETGAFFAEAGLDALFTFGAAALGYATGAARAGLPLTHIHENPDPSAPRESARALAAYLRPRDVLLVKASRVLAAERIVSALENEISN